MTLVCMVTMSGVKAQDESIEEEAIKTIPFQLTFITPLGTNGIQSGKVANNASINMLAVYLFSASISKMAQTTPSKSGRVTILMPITSVSDVLID